MTEIYYILLFIRARENSFLFSYLFVVSDAFENTYIMHTRWIKEILSKKEPLNSRKKIKSLPARAKVLAFSHHNWLKIHAAAIRIRCFVFLNHRGFFERSIYLLEMIDAIARRNDYSSLYYFVFFICAVCMIARSNRRMTRDRREELIYNRNYIEFH